MKKTTLLLASLSLFACSKHHSNGSNTAPNNSYISSVSDFDQGTRIVDSLIYDNSHRVASFSQYAFDSTGGSPVMHYWTAAFTLPSDTSQPASDYVYSQDGGPQTSHQLSYDAQGRIVRDSALTLSGPVISITYPGSSIAINVRYSASPQDNSADTVVFNNGNATTALYYLPNDNMTADSLEGDLNFAFGPYGNPAYHSKIALNLGPLLWALQINGFGGTWDFNSIRAMNAVTDVLASQGSGPTSSTYTYNQVADSQGRLVVQYPFAGSYLGLILFRYY